MVPAISTPQEYLSSGCDRPSSPKRSIPRGCRTRATFGALEVALVSVMRPPCWSRSPACNVAIAVSSRTICCRSRSHDRFARNVAPIIREIQSTGVASHRGIARSLNARGVTTARGASGRRFKSAQSCGVYGVLRAVNQTTNKQQTTSKANPLPNSVLKVVSPLPMPFDRTVTWRQFAHQSIEMRVSISENF